uniref:proline-rich receptor-like protein kinase PERK5 n=1 Tax=Myodes glareolus TaxID=447135 RepID=UPI00202175E4|nr:proline-rich receptor-like protein kinase PERK5 [Myodes glareolus]
MTTKAHPKPAAPEPGTAGVEPPDFHFGRVHEPPPPPIREQPAATGQVTRPLRGSETRAGPHPHGCSGPRLGCSLPPGPGISQHFTSDHYGRAPANKSPAQEGPPTPGVRDQRDKRREWPALACKTHLQPRTLVLQALRVPISPFARI